MFHIQTLKGVAAILGQEEGFIFWPPTPSAVQACVVNDFGVQYNFVSFGRSDQKLINIASVSSQWPFCVR
jgi:hypothetical protein